jgi:hypothetical protein
MWIEKKYYLWAHDDPELPITETRLYNFAEHFVYMSWYYKRGMAMIWYMMNIDEQLSQPVPYSEEPMDELAYVLRSH